MPGDVQGVDLGGTQIRACRADGNGTYLFDPQVVVLDGGVSSLRNSCSMRDRKVAAEDLTGGVEAAELLAAGNRRLVTSGRIDEDSGSGFIG